MRDVFKALKIKATTQEIKAVIDQMDTNGDGEISFDEFVRVMGEQFYKKYSDEEIKQAFK
jgi:Ca2+-binding EF-hand superfamily protein